MQATFSKKMIVGMLCVALMGQTAAVCQADLPTAGAAANVLDVALDAGGQFHGQLISMNGAPVSQARVDLLRIDRPLPVTCISGALT